MNRIFNPDQCAVFWTTQGPNGLLTNFAPTPFKVLDVTMPTAEHMYQALKVVDANESALYRLQADILDQPTPKLAKVRAYEMRELWRTDWEKVKIAVMRLTLYYKFRGNEQARAALLETWGKMLVEKSSFDAYWGAVPYRDENNRQVLRGRNVLGHLMEEARLREQWIVDTGRVPKAPPVYAHDDPRNPLMLFGVALGS